MTELSRRDFLKGIAAGTLSVAGMGVLNAVAPAALAEEAPATTKIRAMRMAIVTVSRWLRCNRCKISSALANRFSRSGCVHLWKTPV